MNKENTEKLFNQFPSLYQGKNLGPQKNLMCFGFECGDGWFDLIYALSKKICELSPETVAMQVKEKFGTMRFYVSGAVSEVFDIIDEYEELSGKVCEECGAPGEGRDGGWIKTLCDGCHELSEINQLR